MIKDDLNFPHGFPKRPVSGSLSFMKPVFSTFSFISPKEISSRNISREFAIIDPTGRILLLGIPAKFLNEAKPIQNL